MSDRRSTDLSPGRRRAGTIAALVLLAFALGAALAVIMVRQRGWGVPQPTPTPVVKLVAVPTPTTAAAAASDPATLATREAALGAQLATLEARLQIAQGDAAAAGGQAGRAEGLLVLVAARRALDRGQPLGWLEPEIAARFGARRPVAVRYVVEAARQPVTLEDLRQGFDAIAPDLASGARGSWWRAFGGQLRTLVVLRDRGTPSPLPADRLRRARRLLDAGEVEAARAEVARLPGAADAGAWLAAARRYALARRALDVLEGSALGR